jgi:hypothetical protein
MKEKAKSLVEGVSESTVACLLAMVQGNILALTISHLAVAAQTGVIAGVLALVFGLVIRLKSRWTTPALLGLCTAVVDYQVHPGSFGGAAGEAIVTGIVAGVLSYLVFWLSRVWVRRKSATTEP